MTEPANTSIRVPRPLKQLTADALQVLEASGQDAASFRGVAVYDTAKDEMFTGLCSFAGAREEISRLPLVADRYGIENVDRLVLQWVYQVLPRVASSGLDPAVDSLWADFLGELAEPWTFRAVANMRHFTMDPALALQPIDGVVIRGRSLDALAALGFDQPVMDSLFEDWTGFGASSYVLVAEQQTIKAPTNLILGSDGTLWSRGARLMQAMRLVQAGEVSFGHMLTARPARFNVGIGGLGRFGWSIPAAPTGATYELTEDLWSRVREVYAELKHLQSIGYKHAPGNLDLALRSFMATYDRWPTASDSQLIDTITAAEALLGTDTEVTFRLAFRLAGILGAGSATRGQIFQSVKGFYDARSKLVHGAALKPKHHKILDQVHEMRQYVRMLLRALVRDAASPNPVHGKTFFENQLDLVLQDEQARQKLRVDLGLEDAIEPTELDELESRYDQ